jgi:hypothetical protein
MGNLTGGVLQAWRFAVDYMDDRRRTNAMKREFGDLGADECSAILSDLGLTSQDFHEAMRLPYASQDLSAAALESLRVHRAAFRTRYGAWNRDIERTCMMCLHRRRCLRELTEGTFAASYRQFCPNRENLGDVVSDPEAGAYMRASA